MTGRGSGGRTFCDNENAALTSTPKPTRTSRNEISLIVRECTTPQNEYKSFNISTLDLSHLDNDEKEKVMKLIKLIYSMNETN